MIGAMVRVGVQHVGTDVRSCIGARDARSRIGACPIVLGSLSAMT